jgi:hypothetical protein
VIWARPDVEMDDGFHRTPLVHGRLKALQYVFPRAVGAAQYQLSNELNSLACAAQYDGGLEDAELVADD